MEQDGFTTVHVTDNVNNPKHYNSSGIECIQAIKAMLTEEEYKNGDEDLNKAEWYLNYLNKGDKQ